MESNESTKWYHYRRTEGTRLAGPWILTWAVSTVLLTSSRLPEVLHAVVALLPVPAFIWFLWRYIKHIRGLDELHHRIELEALAIAFPLSVALLMILGQFQLARPAAEGITITSWFWLYLAGFYLLGRGIARRRYA
jgi:hypothetical protein